MFTLEDWRNKWAQDAQEDQQLDVEEATEPLTDLDEF